MVRTTRRSLLAAVGVGLSSAGCLARFEDGLGEGAAEDGTTKNATTSGTTTDETSTPENPITEQPPDSEKTVYASDSPDPDHSITVESETGESRRVRVRIVRRATGETVFETTDDALGKHTLYNLRQADPEGVEAFRICAELVGSEPNETESGTSRTTSDESNPRRDCATIRTSECYGDAHVTVRDGGSVQIVYAIC